MSFDKRALYFNSRFSRSTVDAQATSLVLRDPSGNIAGNVLTGTLLTGNVKVIANVTTAANIGTVVPPANVVGYVSITVGGTERKVPFYAA